ESLITVDITGLLELEDLHRWRLLDLLSSIDRPVDFRVDRSRETELLLAVLHLVPPPGDLRRFAAAKRAAQEAAALMPEGAIEASCTQIAQRMREQGVSARLASVQMEVRRIVESARGRPNGSDEDVVATLPDAPVPS